MSAPLAIDLFCGLGGWTEGLLAEGYDVVGFDIERRPYPAQLVIQDVLTLHGSQFKDAALIVASPPCQEYSYMAMPWSRAKAIAAEYRAGTRDVAKLKALFYACFRIQIEASHAASRYIPLVVENVRGAQPWVGAAKANYGSFYLWGDVGMVGRRVVGIKPRFGESVAATKAVKVPGFRFDGHGGSFQAASVKVAGLNFSNSGKPGYKAEAFNTTAEQRHRQSEKCMVIGGGKHHLRGKDDPGKYWSGSAARKAASAAIAKIPFPLARHIARAYYPEVSL